MAHGQIGEDEVASLGRAVQVGNACYGHASQDRTDRWCAAVANLRDWAGIFQRSEQEEVGIVGEGDVSFIQVIVELGFIDSQFNDRWRVDGTAVSG